MSASEADNEPEHPGICTVTSKWYHINREFLPIRLVYFWSHVGSLSILPLLTLHMTSIGLTLHDVAQVYLFLPLASFLGPPMVGYAADRTGHISRLYIACLVLHCALHQALLLVPVSAHTTPAALAQHAAGRQLACVDWPPPACANWSVSLNCRLHCDGDGDGGGGAFRACPDGACAPVDADALLELAVDGDGCVREVRVVGNGSELTVPAGRLDCAARCRLDCAPSGARPASRRLTFWLYFWLRMSATFFLAPTFTLLDATNLALVKQHRAPGQNFGRQRVSGIMGSVVMPPLVGVVIDAVSGPEGINYSPAFYFMDFGVVVTIITLFVFHLEISLPEKAHIRQLTKILKRPDALVFVMVVIVLGSMWGFLENFLFIFLKQLNAPNYMLGLTMTVAGLSSIPFNWWSDVICNRVGHVNILIIAFAGYAVRYVGYSFIKNPWLCFPFELLEVVTTHLMWNSAATYAGHLAPPGLLATLIGFAGALHYSFGRGVGSFLGGYLMSSKGASYTYRLMGTVSGVCGVLYGIVHYGWLRGRISSREERKRAQADLAAKDGFGEGPHELAAMMEEKSISTA